MCSCVAALHTEHFMRILNMMKVISVLFILTWRKTKPQSTFGETVSLFQRSVQRKPLEEFIKAGGLSVQWGLTIT